LIDHRAGSTVDRNQIAMVPPIDGVCIRLLTPRARLAAFPYTRRRIDAKLK
jgi:hypothetical protein